MCQYLEDRQEEYIREAEQEGYTHQMYIDWCATYYPKLRHYFVRHLIPSKDAFVEYVSQLPEFELIGCGI
jgi:hypothetical protein